MAEIVVFRNDEEVRRVPLDDGEVTIGRLDDNAIAIRSNQASRYHAKIVARSGGYVLEDLGSVNGCRIGDEKVKKHRLVDGDAILIANYRLVFRSTSRRAKKSPVATPERKPEQFRHIEEGSIEPSTNWDLMQSVFHDPAASKAGARRLQALFEISQSLEAAQDFNAVLIEIMDKAISIMGGEHGFLMLVDQDTGDLRVHVARDKSGEITGIGRDAFSRSLVQRVIDERKPLLVAEAQGEDWCSGSVYEHSIRSVICAPLMTRDTVTGVIYVDHRKVSNVFTRQDLAFFSTFAVQAKAAIDNSRAYWELVDSLFRASDDFVVVCTPKGTVQQANRTATELLGLSGEELAGKPLADLVTQKCRASAEALCQRTLESGVVSGAELELIGVDGRTIPLSVSSFVMHDRQGDAIGFCLIGRDLTELKELISKLTQANEFIKGTFGRYLSDEVVESLLESPEGLELGGERREVTVLISDLRGFTPISERLEPEQVVRLLNNHLGVMTEIIARHRGTIDEFLGDAILVIFGAPEVGDDDAHRGATCAVEMQRAMETVNSMNVRDGLPEVEMGIGLNTGEVVVGNIGSERRSKYAVVGAAVNTGYRIENATVGGQILISEGTRAAVGDGIELDRRMELNVKGLEDSLVVHELIGVNGICLAHETDERRVLDHPLKLRFAKLSGKRITGEVQVAELVALGERTAELRSKRLERPLTSLRIALTVTGAPPDDIYAKVIDDPSSQDTFVVRFTSVPPEVRSYFDRIRS